MMRLGYLGGHNSSAAVSFAARVLAPLLAEGRGAESTSEAVPDAAAIPAGSLSPSGPACP